MDNEKIFHKMHMFAIITAIIMLSLCSCGKSMNEQNTRENMKCITIVSEEYIDGSLKEETYTLSREDSERLLKELDLSNLVFSEDVLKIEPEKSYSIIISEKESISINRDEINDSLYYMIRIKNGAISGTYVSEKVIELLDEMLCEQPSE